MAKLNIRRTIAAAGFHFPAAALVSGGKTPKNVTTGTDPNDTQGRALRKRVSAARW
jgi:hypothetical protein